MTEQEKKIRRYIKAVKRRLEMPGELRERVIRDFESDLTARREAGQSYEEIVAELGDPKKAAGELNGQMKECIRPKSPWRYFFAALTALGAVRLLPEVIGRLLLLFLQIKERVPDSASSVGVIGGADGPTAVFVTVSSSTRNFLTSALLAVGIGGLMLLSWRRRR